MAANATESASPAAHAPPRVSRARLLLRGGASGSLVLGRLALALFSFGTPSSSDPLSLACGNATNASTNATPPQLVQFDDAPAAFGSAFPLVWALHGPPEESSSDASYVARLSADAPCDPPLRPLASPPPRRQAATLPPLQNLRRLAAATRLLPRSPRASATMTAWTLRDGATTAADAAAAPVLLELTATAGASHELSEHECLRLGASSSIALGVHETMKTGFIIGIITAIAIPLIAAVILPLVMIACLPILKPIIKLMSDLFEAILNPLMKAAMGDDTKSGILAPGYFGPYAGGFWPYQYGLMESRADALGIGAIKASMKGPNSGGNQQLNGLFYGLYVQQIVDLMSKGISNGMMKFCVKPLAVRRAIRAHFCAILRANRRNSLTARLALDRC